MKSILQFELTYNLKIVQPLATPQAKTEIKTKDRNIFWAILLSLIFKPEISSFYVSKIHF